MSLNSFSTFKHTLTQADSLTLCTMYHTSLIQAAVVLLKDWNCCLVTSQIWTRSCFFFFPSKRSSTTPILCLNSLSFIYVSAVLLCQCASHLWAIWFSFFLFYRTTDGVVFLLRNNQNYISEPVQQSGAFWKSYARTRAHLSEEGSIKCSKLLWSKISEQSCWTEVAVYLSWPWQTPARFTIQ